MVGAAAGRHNAGEEAAIDALSTIDAPSGISGSAFCTVKSRPFT